VLRQAPDSKPPISSRRVVRRRDSRLLHRPTVALASAITSSSSACEFRFLPRTATRLRCRRTATKSSFFTRGRSTAERSRSGRRKSTARTRKDSSPGTMLNRHGLQMASGSPSFGILRRRSQAESAGAGLVVIDAAGGDERIIAEASSAPEWSPDGKRLVFVSDCNSIAVASVEDGPPTFLARDAYEPCGHQTANELRSSAKQAPVGLPRACNGSSSPEESERIEHVPANRAWCSASRRNVGSIGRTVQVTRFCSRDAS
jgi:WD40-like Beta Propeller Repeat